MNRRQLWISLLLLWSLAPMLWQLISSFTTTAALVDGGVPFLQRWTLIHYRQLLSSDPPFWRFLLNSTVLASASTVLTIAHRLQTVIDYDSIVCLLVINQLIASCLLSYTSYAMNRCEM